MGGANSVFNTVEEKISIQKLKLVFESEKQISNFEKDNILNYKKLFTNKFIDLYNLFCCDYPMFDSEQATYANLNEYFGDMFFDFIKNSHFFKINYSIPVVKKLDSGIKDNLVIEKPLAEFSTKEMQKNNQNKFEEKISFDKNKLRLLIFLLSSDTIVTTDDSKYNDRVYKIKV